MPAENPPAIGRGTDKRIQRATGASDLDALRIAATEMDGANEGAGGINARQTHCGTLRYEEGLPPSRGALEGRNVTQQAAAQALGIDISGLSPEQAQKQIDAETDRWLSQNSRRR